MTETRTSSFSEWLREGIYTGLKDADFKQIAKFVDDLASLAAQLEEALEPALMRISVLQTNSGTDSEILGEGWVAIEAAKDFRAKYEA